jgi:hypothetical protein
MPLHVRSIAVSISVLSFFGLSLIGWLSGLSPYVCCKRAIAGALIAYIAGSVAVRAVNAVLIDAMIESKNEKINSGDSVGTRNS